MVVLGVVANSKTLFNNILPPTNATVDYAIGLEKLSANKQFLDDDKTAFVTDNSKK